MSKKDRTMDKIIEIGIWIFASVVSLCLAVTLIAAAIGINLDPHFH